MNSDTAKPIPPEVLASQAGVLMTPGVPVTNRELRRKDAQLSTADMIRRASSLEILERLMLQAVKFNANTKTRRRIQAAYESAKARLSGELLKTAETKKAETP